MLGRSTKNTQSKKKKSKTSITVDLIEQNDCNIKIVGWYLAENVKSVELVNQKSGDKLPQQTISFIPRPDVETTTGKSAQGFQLDCLSIAADVELCLASTSNSGKTERQELITSRSTAGSNSNTAKSLGVACDHLVCCDNHVVFVGWALELSNIVSIELLSADNERLSHEASWLRTPRQDVLNSFSGANHSIRNPGIVVRFGIEGARANVLNQPLRVNFVTEQEQFSLTIAQAADYLTDKNIALSQILKDWNPLISAHREEAKSVILPAVHDFAANIKTTSADRCDYGPRVENPRATVLIPLYGRFDFMRFQLSAFARYGGTEQLELIYVVDDPSIETGVSILASELLAVFGISFSVVNIHSNVGFGAANNIGASFASASKLILLNSDVLPSDGNWATSLLDYLDTLPSAGIVGVRLLFEDGSIQHDGMAPFVSHDYPGLFLNGHPMKGWPLNLSPHAAKPQETMLLTAACVAIEKALYDDLDGFDPAFILGDFEDSDLCMRAIASGKINYICRDICLHHLERQSQDLVDTGEWKQKLTMANAISYNERWASLLKTTQNREQGELARV